MKRMYVLAAFCVLVSIAAIATAQNRDGVAPADRITMTVVEDDAVVPNETDMPQGTSVPNDGTQPFLGAQNRLQPHDRPDTTLLPGVPMPVPLTTMSEYWIGVQCSPVMPALRSHLNLKEKQGVMVDWVMPESPADKAGLELYDVILKLDDTSVASVEEIIKKIDVTKDTELNVTLIRHGKEIQQKLKPEKRPENAQALMLPPQDGMFRSIRPGVVIEGFGSGDQLNEMQQIPPEFQKMIEQMHKQMEEAQKRGDTRIYSNPLIDIPYLQQPQAVAPEMHTNTLQVIIEPKENGEGGTLTVKKNNQLWSVSEFTSLPKDVQKEVTELLKNTAGDKSVGEWVDEQIAGGRRITFSVSSSTVNTEPSSDDQQNPKQPNDEKIE